MREVIITSTLPRWCPWLNFNNLGLVLGTDLKFYSVRKRLQLKVRKFRELIPTFGEVEGKKIVAPTFLPSILNRRVNSIIKLAYKIQAR